jgi:hypothetical protein
MRMGVARQEAAKARKAFEKMLPTVERYRSEGYWVSLTLIVEGPIRVDLTGFDDRTRFACWQLRYARSEAGVRDRDLSVRAAPSREETRQGRLGGCKPSRDDWQLRSFEPMVAPPHEAFVEEIADPDGFASWGTYLPVWWDFGTAQEPETVRVRRLSITSFNNGPRRFRILDLRTGEPMAIQELSRSRSGISILLAAKPRGVAECRFIPLESVQRGQFVLEQYKELRGERRTGWVVWQVAQDSS